MTVAFFDLDKTLLSVNSGSLWLKREVQGGFISYWEALRATGWMLQYHLGFADLEDAVRETIGTLAGTKESVLAERVDAFYARDIQPLYRPRAREVVEEHRAAGDRLVLLTSASIYLAEHVAKELHLDDVIANRFEVDDTGIYTGKPLGRLCFGRGKREWAEEYTHSRGLALERAAFYTDSMADLPLLEVIGRPVVVNPDPRLRRLALKRGWRVEDWGTPTATTGSAPRNARS